MNLATSTIFTANCWPDSRWTHRRTMENGPLKKSRKNRKSRMLIIIIIFDKSTNCFIKIHYNNHAIFSFPHCSISFYWIHTARGKKKIYRTKLLSRISPLKSREKKIFLRLLYYHFLHNEDYLLPDKLCFSLQLTTEWLKLLQTITKWLAKGETFFIIAAGGECW